MAIVLASVNGTRLRPITNPIPKPLVKVESKPIIPHTIDGLERNVIKAADVTVCYKADKLVSHLTNYKLRSR